MDYLTIRLNYDILLTETVDNKIKTNINTNT